MHLFQQLLGPSFAQLPTPVQCVHQPAPQTKLTGRAVIERGTSWLGRIMGAMARLPPAGSDVPVQVNIVSRGAHQYWTRNFGTHRMASLMTARGDLLYEKLGAVHFLFQLHGSEQGILWKPVSIRALGIPFSRWLFRFNVLEGAYEGRYHFDVGVDVRGLGLLIRYSGWLDPDESI